MADEVETVVDGFVASWASTRARLTRFGAWRRDLTAELVQLPDTMRRFREGAANFELVGQRLAKSSASLEGISDLYESTIAESGRRSAQAVDALRSQVDALTNGTVSPERVTTSMNEMQRALETIAELNPFWPKPTRKR